MKKFHLIIILFLTLFGNAACGQNYTPDVLNEIRMVENGLIPGILVKGEPEKRYTLTERMAFYNVPGLSIAVIRDGKIRWAKGYGIANTRTGKAVDVNTIFQAGSISKPLAALGALLLVQEGKVDLDTDVNTYLKTWKVPENEFTKTEKVTLRRLLTHSAGMTVHGFPGYGYLDKFPDIETVLNGKGNTPAIFVDVVPGTIWRYSGGGYTVMEKMVEDMTGMPLEKYLAKKVLRPLGMKNSTYEQPLPKKRSKQASAAYHGDGEIVEGLWHNYPEQAAAGLWTTPSDLARYCIEIQEALAGKSHKVLNQETVGKMLTKHLSNWGLGPSLRWDADSLIFQHGGKNEGFTNNMMAFARRGDGLIVMTSADRGGDLIAEINRTVSKLYGWNVYNPKVIEVIRLEENDLAAMAGKYKLTEQVPGIGDYLVDVTVEDNGLKVFDPNNNETNHLKPAAKDKFTDLNTGDEVVIKMDANGKVTGFVWNGRFVFLRVE